MPWTNKQVRLAEAVKHGFKPTGKAKGFTPSFADQVISEGGGKKRKKKTKAS